MVRKFKTADQPLLEKAGLGRFAVNCIRWQDKGICKPEQCFVWEEDGSLLAGIAYAVFDSMELDILDFAFCPEQEQAGAKLLEESLIQHGAGHFELVSYHLYHDMDDYGQVKFSFLGAGFEVFQEKYNYHYVGDEPLQLYTQRLRYRPLSQVGRDVYVEAIRLVTQDTLDRMDRLEVERMGEQAAAENQFESLSNIHCDPELWLLGYWDGELAGLVVPQDFGKGTGAINYIGVVPAYRGNGFSRDFLHRGTEVLLQRGIHKVIADIDADNHPMQETAEWLGYERQCEMVVLAKKLQ